MAETGDRAGDRAGPRAANLVRYGPVALVAVALLAVIALSIGGGEESTTTTTPPSDEVGAPAPTGRMPITYAEAVEQGTDGDHEWGERCDVERGTIAIPTIRAVPCVPVFDGDNAGETHIGVTADTIRIVQYRADPSGDLTSLLSGMGVQEDPADVTSTIRDYFTLYSSVYETYGRDIEVIAFQGTGDADDEVAARADATQIAEEIEPFAVIGAPGLDRGAFASVLAEHGVLCMGCGVALPDARLQELAPYVWGSAPTPEQFLHTLAAWMNQADDDSPLARYAGDPELASQVRRVGVVHFEQDPPVYTDVSNERLSLFEGDAAVVETYLLELPTMPQRATEIVAKLKDEQVTTVMFLGDPLMPIYLTAAATEQEYFPEWIFTGTALTDTNFMGRQWDAEQMGSAFGLSNGGVKWAREEMGTSLQLYQWYFGAESWPPATEQYAVHTASPTRIMQGIHMAGPDLTPQTFERGMFRLPPTGGTPGNARVSYGRWGVFPDADYLAVDDSTEIWWDADAVGIDEIGNEGPGMWRFSNGGQRFTAADAPVPRPFVEEGTVLQFDEYPPGDAPPAYPPPAGSPAATVG